MKKREEEGLKEEEEEDCHLTHGVGRRRERELDDEKDVVMVLATEEKEEDWYVTHRVDHGRERGGGLVRDSMCWP